MRETNDSAGVAGGGVAAAVPESGASPSAAGKRRAAGAGKKKAVVGQVKRGKDGAVSARVNGRSERQPVDVAALAEEYQMYWQSGGNFYFRPPDTERWMPLTDTRMKMFLKMMGLEEARGGGCGEVERLMMHVMVNRPVDIVMDLAGHFPGLVLTPDKKRLLIPDGPNLLEPVKGEFPLIAGFMEALLCQKEVYPEKPRNFVVVGDKARSEEVWAELCQPVYKGSKVYMYDQRGIVFSWLKQIMDILYKRRDGLDVKRGGPALIMAGPKNSGKSLISEFIIAPLLGHRKADPSQFLAKDTSFNSDLYGAEGLFMDDSPLGSDYESRRKMAEFVKHCVAAATHRFHPKGGKAFVVPTPVWRLVWAINDDKANLQQLPEMNESTLDKFHLVHVVKEALPMPTTTLEEYMAFGKALREEVPHFAHWLLNEYEIPVALRGGRFGIEAIHAPDLMEELFEDSRHGGLLELVDAAHWESSTEGRLNLWQWLDRAENANYGRIAEDGAWIGTAIELSALLQQEECNVAREARDFLKKARPDMMLSELKNKKPDRVSRPDDYRRKVGGVIRREWRVVRG